MKDNFDLAKAIDFCDSAFVFIDTDFIVEYLNFKAFEIFRVNEDKFAQEYHDFCYYKVHNNPLLSIMDVLQKQNQYEKFDALQLGERLIIHQHVSDKIFEIKITPIFNQPTQRTGSCLEYSDITTLYNANQQFDIAIDAGARGDFSYQINVDELDHRYERFLGIYNKINGLFRSLSNFITDLSMSLENIAGGNLAYCNMELALMPEIRQEQLECSTCNKFDGCLQKNYVNPDQNFSLYQHDNYLHTIKKDIHYTFQNLWNFILKIQSNQKVLEHSIKKITESYSEVAMSTESEYVKAKEIQTLITERLSLFNHINSEIDQATHIRDITIANHETLHELKQSLDHVSNKIIHISHVIQTFETILSHHSDALLTGLKYIEHGDLGKGFAVVHEQSMEIVNKSKYAISEIKSILSHINESTSESNHVIVDKMGLMNQQIDTLSLMMSGIQNAVQEQEKTTLEMKCFIDDIQFLLVNTVGQIETMIYSTSDLVSVHLELKKASDAFNLNKELFSTEETEKTKNYYNINNHAHDYLYSKGYIQLWEEKS